MQRLLTLSLKAEFTRHSGQTYRKKIVFDYKKGDRHSHKNTHAIPLKVKDGLLRSHKGGDWKKIRQLERQSLKPFGKFTRSGFIFDKEKLPFYYIPNLEGFELKPYVEYNCPKLSSELTNFQAKINAEKLQKLRAN